MTLVTQDDLTLLAKSSPQTCDEDTSTCGILHLTHGGTTSDRIAKEFMRDLGIG